MPRAARIAPGGIVYHVLNRAAGRRTLFEKDLDYLAFERVLAATIDRFAVRLLTYCLMPTHWHLVLWPAADGLLSASVKWMTLTHAMRRHAHYHSAGTGHIYQGRFKAFPVQADEHLLTVCRYVERNPVRAGFVTDAATWRWSSLWWREHPHLDGGPTLSPWPIDQPAGWRDLVNEALTVTELRALRDSAQRGTPYGSAAWQKEVVEQFGIEPAKRPGGRPPKPPCA